MNVYDDYKYPINEIFCARKNKDHNRLKMLLKCYKRMNQGVLSVPMWYTDVEDTGVCGIIINKPCQYEGFYMSGRDLRK